MPNDRGFTLLEVLIAFIIAALALGVLFQGATIALNSVRVSGQYEEAVSRARSRMAMVGAGGSLRAGEQEGADGNGFHWQVRVAPLAEADLTHGDQTGNARAARAVLYQVVVTVSWKSREIMRHFQLESRRVGAAPPAL